MKRSIHDWKPWEKSTGPRTLMGKAISSRNALKTGLHTAKMIELRKMLAQFERQRREIVDLSAISQMLADVHRAS
ncbi:MAG: hypothetical protein Kow00121_60530 [Elainellaceae cyanobacterium]